MLFNSKGPLPRYSLIGQPLEQVSDVKYLHVTIQENLRFNIHVEKKLATAKQQLGMVKRALNWAPEKAKLVAYKSLCLPHLEYASAAWDPSSKKDITNIEAVQTQAIRFIACIKGRDGVPDAQSRLGLQPLDQRRKSQRISLLMNILSKEEGQLI